MLSFGSQKKDDCFAVDGGEEVRPSSAVFLFFVSLFWVYRLLRGPINLPIKIGWLKSSAKTEMVTQRKCAISRLSQLASGVANRIDTALIRIQIYPFH